MGEEAGEQAKNPQADLKSHWTRTENKEQWTNTNSETNTLQWKKCAHWRLQEE